MQLAKAPREALLRPLQTVSGAVARHGPLPVLSNVLIRKAAGSITLIGCDIETQIQARADVGSGLESAETTVNARKLLDILRAAPDGEVVLSLANRKLTVHAGKSRFNLQTIDARDFPTITAQAFASSFTLPASALKGMLAKVQFAMAVADVRYYLNGVLLSCNGTTLRAVATDGHRLALCESQLPAAVVTTDAIVPRKAITELVRLLPDSDDPVRVDLADRYIKVSFGTVEMLCKLVEGKFPDYQRVIPKGNDKIVDIERQVLLDALSRASILSNDKFNGVRLILAPGVLKITAANADDEEANEELEIGYSGARLEIGFNVTYLLDVLSALSSEKVRMAFSDELTSVLITIPDSATFRYLVMPMRL